MAWKGPNFSIRRFPLQNLRLSRYLRNPHSLNQLHPIPRPVLQLNYFGGSLFHYTAGKKLLRTSSQLRNIESSFQYPRLHPPGKDQGFKEPTIRLLNLLPGFECDQIQCTLSIVSLSTALNYEAISYCWGDPNDKENIICNSSPLAIPSNLAAALRGLRLQDQSRTLWADAICINQESVTEKDSQVQLMRDIFSQADRTLIWLGTSQDKYGESISLIAYISLHIGLLGIRWITRWHILPSIKIRDPVIGGSGTRKLDPFSVEFYLSLVRFLRRPWFQRAWVVQEVVVSRRATLLWDMKEHEWEDVVQVLKAMATVNFPLPFLVSLQHVAAIEHERQRYLSGNVELLGLLMRQQRCLSTDPRDKVFSFCGLLEDSARKSIQMSYFIDTNLVYRNIASEIIQKTQSLDILSRPPIAVDSKQRSLPSWVPDWSVCSTTGRTHSFGLGPRSLAGIETRSGTEFVPRFRTAGVSPHKLSYITNSDELVVEGYIFDRIIDVGPVFEGTELPNAINTLKNILKGWRHTFQTFFNSRSVIISWLQMANSHTYLLSSRNDPLEEVFWQTICAGELFESAKVASAARFWKRATRYSGFLTTHIPRWLDKIGISYGVSVLLLHLIFRHPFLEYELQGRFTLNRRMVITEMGYIGLAAGSTKKGDQLAICKGSSVPLILNQSKEPGKWNLVGDAYIHGIMKGELFIENSCKPLIII
jgi:Heterokaryon incompatibility protein (HET)